MAGPNLEIFKFATYLFFPIAFMYHFGDPDWYDRHVEPAKRQFWPEEESTNKPAKDHAGVRQQLEELKRRRKGVSSKTIDFQESEPQRLV